MNHLEHVASAACLLLLALVVVVAPGQVLAEEPRGAAAVDAAAIAGHWEGAIALPNGQSLDIKVDLAATDGVWSGTIDIPQQGAKELPLAPVSVEGAKVGFVISGIPGEPSFDGAFEEGSTAEERIAGSFAQGGIEMPFHLGRNTVAAPRRPQHPEPPFPYDVREVRYPNGDLTLAGTLTTPRGVGPFPAAILITGSGTQDRDESLMGHRPFLVLADHLTRAGIAVLRVDDRGAGGSTGDPSTATSADYAGDVETSLAFLSEQPKIDSARVGLIGHSEGGLIAPMVASRNDAVAYVVLMAGTGVPGFDILMLQHRLILEASGVSGERLATLGAIQRRIFEAVVADLPETQLRTVISEAVDTQIAFTPEAERPSAEAIETLKKSSVAQVQSPWMRYFLAYDPRPALRATTVPVLAINGELDLQVDADQNLTAIEQALTKGGNREVTIVQLPKLNHLLQTAETGSPDRYATIEETIALVALDTIATWILEHFGR